MGRSSRNSREMPSSRQVYTSSDEEYTTDFYTSDNGASTASPTIRCPHPPSEIRSSSLRKYRKNNDGSGDDEEMAAGGGLRSHNSKALFEPSDTEGESSNIRNQPPLARKSRNWPGSKSELTRERSAFVYEDNDDGSIEARDVSKWPDYWNGDDQSNKKRVCTRRRFCALFCCLLIIGLVVILVFAVRNQTGEDSIQEEQQQAVAATSEGSGGTEPETTPVIPVPAPAPVETKPEVPAPTPAPTPATIPVPVPDTTPGAGGTCIDEIGTSTDTYCIAANDPILVGFTSCNTKQDEWIGLYSVDKINDGSKDLGPLHTDWLWTCYIVGDIVDECRSQDFLKGVVPFASNLLEPGTYQAFLVYTNDLMEYVPMKASEPFTVTYCPTEEPVEEDGEE